MNKKCQVFTPPDYVKQLLNSVGYKHNLIGKKILENSCGDGNILIEIVKRYILDCQRQGFTKEDIKAGLENDVIGIEIDGQQYKKCLRNLDAIITRAGISAVSWNIYNEDFLRRVDNNTYDFIVGNPPYITYNEIDKKDLSYLQENFVSCKKGKFDYCYAFMEKSLSMLSANGKMAYLIPSSIFKTVFGWNLRCIMLPKVTSIQDYTRAKLFDSALVKSAIVTFENGSVNTSINYKDDLDNSSRKVKKKVLKDKWTFIPFEKGINRFGDYYTVSHVVATLLNKAFVLKEYVINDKGNYVCGNYEIEKEIVRDTASPKTLRTSNTEKIIFPYYYENGNLKHYSEEEFKMKFPGAYVYLESYKQELLRRDTDKSVKWFEYGRTQALSKLDCEKCLISTIISSELPIYELDKDCIPYAGMYIAPKTDDIRFDSKEAIRILQEPRFREYVECIGIHINGDSLRITSKDIEDYTF